MRLSVLALTFIMPLAATAEEYWVPVVAHTSGVNDTVWRSAVGVLNSCPEAASVELRLHMAGGVAAQSFTIEAGRLQVFDDVVALLTPGEVLGPLEIQSDQPLTITSRTYNLTPDGTFGQSLDGVTSADGLASTETASLQQLQENSHFRTNLGVLNMGGGDAAATVALYDHDGVLVGSFDLELAAGELVQEGRPYRTRFGYTDIGAGYAFVTVTSGSGVHAYASVVDADTGDPTTVAMQTKPASCQSSSEGLVVETYDPQRAYNGLTLIGQIGAGEPSRVYEVNMLGEVVWELDMPPELADASGGIEVQSLDSGNLLIMIFNRGVYEVTRSGELVWSHPVSEISHDADRLSNGNTIYVFGMGDAMSDAQVTEIDPAGNTVWQWFAEDAYGTRFPNVEIEGWTHINAVQRLTNGNTLVSLRNFALTSIVDSSGAVVEEVDWSPFGTETMPHDPVALPNGNILVCVHAEPDYHAAEVNRTTGETVWTYRHPTPLRTTRDCDRLPNGNTLIVGVKDEGDGATTIDESTIIEVTPTGDVVWQLTLAGVAQDTSPGLFFKAERVGTGTGD